MIRKRFNVTSFIDNRLEQIGGAGHFVGRMLGMLGGQASKVIIGLGVLLVFGVAVFIWSILQGMKKGNKSPSLKP